MTFRYLSVVAIGTALFAGSATADTYKPSDFLKLDLQKALLSPKPLGPGASFEAYPIEARADAKNAIDAQADTPAVPKAVPVAKPQRQAVKRAAPARTRIARPRSNPLDANAMDTRIQTWPCRTGGICNWRR